MPSARALSTSSRSHPSKRWPACTDGVLLVSFVTRGGIGDLGLNLLVRGTVAVALPAQSNANACSILGLENLEFLDPLTF